MRNRRHLFCLVEIETQAGEGSAALQHFQGMWKPIFRPELRKQGYGASCGNAETLRGK